MDRCQQIVANVRMEERYEGMSLRFDGSEVIRKEIEEAIEKIKEQTKMTPLVFGNSKDYTESSQAFYIEFNDESQRNSGDFFERLLRELKIDHCVNDVIEEE